MLVSVLSKAQDDVALHSKINSYIAPYVATKNFSGTVLVSKGDKIVYEKSFGLANEDFEIANQLNTVYHVASVSKNFTAAAILILEERGLLSTKDVLSKYIPDFTRANEIMIHQLLIHSSGIPNINDMEEYVKVALLPQTPESLVAVFKNKPLNFNPGEKYSYSNSNYNVLAFIIEKVSEKKFGDFLQEEIFKPSGMINTGHHGKANSIIKNCAIGYQSDGHFGLEKSDYLDWSSKTGNGSLYTTVEDLFHWHRTLASGKVLSKAAQEKMYTDHLSNTGYGCFVRDHFNRKRVYMNGRSPGFTSYFVCYPSEDVCIVVLANTYIPVPSTIGMDIAAILFGEKYEVPKLSVTKPNAATVKKLIGRYQFDDKFYRPNFLMTVSEIEGQLITDWGELIPNEGLNFTGRGYWSTIGFEQDGNGNITSMIFDGQKGKRLD